MRPSALAKAREDLERAKRLEKVGMIAGGVAQKVRNPLFAIQAIVAALERKVADQPEFGEYVTHVKGQARRLNALMEDLQTLGRPTDPAKFVPFDLRQVLTDVSAVFSASGGNVRALVMELGREPLKVRGIAEKLQQVFASLVQHAPLSGATFTHRLPIDSAREA